MNWQEHIVTDSAVLVGKPIIRGSRLSVEFVLELLSQGWSEAEIAGNYMVECEQIRACLAYARWRLSEEKTYTAAA
jgi:uncharacterized protein (DUF433 family)